MGESGCGNKVNGDSLTDVVVKVMVMDGGEWMWW